MLGGTCSVLKLFKIGYKEPKEALVNVSLKLKILSEPVGLSILAKINEKYSEFPLEVQKSKEDPNGWTEAQTQIKLAKGETLKSLLIVLKNNDLGAETKSLCVLLGEVRVAEVEEEAILKERAMKALKSVQIRPKLSRCERGFSKGVFYNVLLELNEAPWGFWSIFKQARVFLYFSRFPWAHFISFLKPYVLLNF